MKKFGMKKILCLLVLGLVATTSIFAEKKQFWADNKSTSTKANCINLSVSWTFKENHEKYTTITVENRCGRPIKVLVWKNGRNEDGTISGKPTEELVVKSNKSVSLGKARFADIKNRYIEVRLEDVPLNDESKYKHETFFDDANNEGKIVITKDK